MRALVCHGPRRVSVEQVPDASIEKPTDALVRITTTNICGSDLHMYEGRTDVEQGKAANVKQYNRHLRNLIHQDKVHPGVIVSQELNLDEAAEGYRRFDDREDGWTKVVLHP